MKIGIYNRWLCTLGGGELHSLGVASVLAKLGAQVTVFGAHNYKAGTVEERLGLDVGGCTFSGDCVSCRDIERMSSEFDLFIHCSIARDVPRLRSRKSVALVFFPVELEEKADKLRMKGYDAVWGNAEFTCHWIRKYWDVAPVVLYPPMNILGNQQRKKENLIINVGRFFAGGHNKKHAVLVDAFAQFVDRGFADWSLCCVGGVGQKREDEQYYLELLSYASGKNVVFKPDLSRSELTSLYSKSAFYWHATGYSVDELTLPGRCEHFGVSTVEAMASGCVPFVVPSGGQGEVVRHLHTGMHWRTINDLVESTIRVTRDHSLRQRIAAEAVTRSSDFCMDQFELNLGRSLASIGLHPPW